MNLLLLAAVSSSLALAIDKPHNDAINEVMDMVESGLGERKEGRALFITLTLTSASTSVSTVSATLTTNSKCIDTAIASCTTTAAAAARNLGEVTDVTHGEAILTTSSGEKVDVHAIQPTKARSILDNLDIDGILHEHDQPLTSGSLSFREVVMENLGGSCGRSEGQRMPRIVIPSVMATQVNFTSTTYVSTEYSATNTFSVPTTYCTNSAYPTDGFFATASVCA